MPIICGCEPAISVGRRQATHNRGTSAIFVRFQGLSSKLGSRNVALNRSFPGKPSRKSNSHPLVAKRQRDSQDRRCNMTIRDVPICSLPAIMTGERVAGKSWFACSPPWIAGAEVRNSLFLWPQRSTVPDHDHGDGRVHHIVMVLDSQGIPLLMVDGQRMPQPLVRKVGGQGWATLVDGQSVGKAVPSTALMMIGRNPLGDATVPAEGWSGVVDELAIYDRALPVSEIDSHHRAVERDRAAGR